MCGLEEGRGRGRGRDPWRKGVVDGWMLFVRSSSEFHKITIALDVGIEVIIKRTVNGTTVCTDFILRCACSSSVMLSNIRSMVKVKYTCRDGEGFCLMQLYRGRRWK